MRMKNILSHPGRTLPRLPVLSLVLLCLLVSAPLTAAAELARFFRMGSGELHLVNHRNNREARVRLLAPDHSLNEAALTEALRGVHGAYFVTFFWAHFSPERAKAEVAEEDDAEDEAE